MGYDADHSPPSGGLVKNAWNVFMFGMRDHQNVIKQEAELTGGIFQGHLMFGNLVNEVLE
jgi:hypothetical protein